MNKTIKVFYIKWLSGDAIFKKRSDNLRPDFGFNCETTNFVLKDYLWLSTKPYT